MRLLFLTFYYPPDLCAGSFRAEALVAALKRRRPANLSVHVVTTMPNRYHGFAPEALLREEQGWLQIDRVPMPAHKSGMRDQASAFAAFARGARRAAADGKYDAVFATSSRLMTGALGAWIARRRGIPLYLDIRDLFTDTMRDVLPGRPAQAALPVFNWIERRTFQSAHTINMVSPGFRDHVEAVTGGSRIRCFTNGVDESFIGADWSSAHSAPGSPRLIVYAGNIGEGQGLEHILPGAARVLAGKARFRVIGGGGRLEALRAALGDSADSVVLLPPVGREALQAHYREADMLFLHLNDHPAFTRVLPSKIFEYAATGKPILAGVAGESAAFINREVEGAAVFPPCDADAMSAAFSSLANVTAPIARNSFVDRHARVRIMDEMADDLLSMLATKR